MAIHNLVFINIASQVRQTFVYLSISLRICLIN